MRNGPLLNGLAFGVGLFMTTVLAADSEAKWYELPPAGEVLPQDRAQWKEAGTGAARAGGLALENKNLLAIVKAGAAEVLLWVGEAKDPTSKKKGLELVVLDGAGQQAPISKVEAIQVGEDRGIRLTAGKAVADLIMPVHSSFVTVRPGPDAGALAIRAAFRYAVLPDFFANDIVYLPQRFKAERVQVPAENFLYGFVDGGKIMSMAIWQGSLTLAENGAGKPPAESSRGIDPKVELELAGEGPARRIVAQRIEFAGRPVHVGLLAHERLWTDVEVSSWKGQLPGKLEWQRPFDAKWRANTICAEGKISKDFYVESLSYTFLYAGDKSYPLWKSEGGLGLHPQDNMQGLWPRWIYTAWFNQAETWIALYADREFRAAKPPPKEFPNIFERVLIYPLDRLAQTPLGVRTPVDLMRETLGQGPCEYVLDLNGLKKRHHGGDKPMHNETATCGVRDRVINPLLKKLKKDEPLSEESKTILSNGMKDMLQFLQAVNARLHEYRKAGDEIAKLCEEAGRKPNTQGVAGKVSPLAKELGVQLDRLFAGVDKGVATWEQNLPGLLDKVASGDPSGASAATAICPLAERQDVMMNQARRFMLGIRTQAFMTETSDPEARVLIQKVCEISQKVLARRHPMEWRAFD